MYGKPCSTAPTVTKASRESRDGCTCAVSKPPVGKRPWTKDGRRSAPQLTCELLSSGRVSRVYSSFSRLTTANRLSCCWPYKLCLGPSELSPALHLHYPLPSPTSNKRHRATVPFPHSCPSLGYLLPRSTHPPTPRTPQSTQPSAVCAAFRGSTQGWEASRPGDASDRGS
jgi:hypothetical protein